MHNPDKRTIAAIATPPGEGGIGVIRMSGDDALGILKRVFKPHRGDIDEFRSHTLYYGDVIDQDRGRLLDEALVTYMKAPSSYTGEDVVEIYCHGGVLVLRSVLELLLRQGACIAEPGEFTKRAFLNNRLDLTQAEAVIDVIRAKTDLSLEAAQNQLKGMLSKKIDAIKDRVAEVLTHIEAELDFPEEEDIGELKDDEIRERLTEVADEIVHLLSTYEEGRVLREGLGVIILGLPNAGKSSLLNILLREERAIVAPVPGTTRDVIEEVININGIPVRLMDTAGLRDTDDEIERIGVRLTRDRLKDAQLVLYVIDATRGMIEYDRKNIEEIEGKKLILVINKVDTIDGKRKAHLDKELNVFEDRVFTSAVTEEGIEELKDCMCSAVFSGSLKNSGSALVARARHKEALDASLEAVRDALNTIDRGLPREFLAVELREALDRLGEITGSVTSEDILDRIFSQFCVGK